MARQSKHPALALGIAAGWMLLLILAGCRGDRGHNGYIARVENAVLTEDDLLRARDSTGETRAFSQEYINEWIVRELLYQEAERRSLPETEEFQRRVREATKRMAVAALLQRELYDNLDTSTVTEEAIKTFFTSKAKEFTLRQDVVLASLAVFDDRDAANTFRSRVLRGIPWTTALQQIENDPQQKMHLLRLANRQFFTQSTLFPEELWKLARSLEREDVSFPLKTAQGTYVIRVHQTYRQGTLPPLDYARNEARQRLLMELRHQKYEALVASLRARRHVDVRLDRLDTTTTQ